MSEVATPLVGIFVGGQGRRMGNLPKGLLLSRDTGEPLVSRLVRIVSELGYEPALVGRAEPYRALHPELPTIPDAPADVGPLGGLAGLLRAAAGRRAIALACDMPFVSPALIARLATDLPGAAVLAPRGSAGLWEPLCARYAAAEVAPHCALALARGVRSFQRLFELLAPVELCLDAGERSLLKDWDRPEDVDS
jgi:molybdopterin-guanine dinucleotide biosynthesis protein A